MKRIKVFVDNDVRLTRGVIRELLRLGYGGKVKGDMNDLHAVGTFVHTTETGLICLMGCSESEKGKLFRDHNAEDHDIYDLFRMEPDDAQDKPKEKIRLYAYIYKGDSIGTDTYVRFYDDQKKAIGLPLMCDGKPVYVDVTE